jgi:hypothetical protein
VPVQTLIALATEVMTDIQVELLPQQPVLGLQLCVFFPQAAILCFQCGHACAQFLELFEQRGVGHTSLTTVKLFCSINRTVFCKNLFTVDTSSFSTALPARESMR